MELYNVEEVTKILRDLKAIDIAVIDISEKVNWVNYMIYATGRSKAHMKAMANALVMELKMRRPGRRWGVDQEGSDFWLLVNSGDILVNFFTEEAREEYDLERTWILRRDDRNPFRSDYDEEAERRWIYDEEDEGYMIDDDPDVAKIKGF
jgi:ribosome-associated protein